MSLQRVFTRDRISAEAGSASLAPQTSRVAGREWAVSPARLFYRPSSGWSVEEDEAKSQIPAQTSLRQLPNKRRPQVHRLLTERFLLAPAHVRPVFYQAAEPGAARVPVGGPTAGGLGAAGAWGPTPPSRRPGGASWRWPAQAGRCGRSAVLARQGILAGPGRPFAPASPLADCFQPRDQWTGRPWTTASAGRGWGDWLVPRRRPLHTNRALGAVGRGEDRRAVGFPLRGRLASTRECHHRLRRGGGGQAPPGGVLAGPVTAPWHLGDSGVRRMSWLVLRRDLHAEITKAAEALPLPDPVIRNPLQHTNGRRLRGYA